MSRKSKKVIKWIIIGLVLGVLTLITFCVWFLTMVFFGGPAYRTTNIKNYQQIYEKEMQTGLIVFPDEITEDMSDTEFSFYWKDTWDDPTVSIFLQCTYTEEAYEAEVERLEYTRKVYGGTVRRLMKDEGEKYPYPAYVAIDNHHSTYEYALLSGEREITYIHTGWFDRENVKFNQEYLPKDFMATQEDPFLDGYSIYIKKIDNAMGYISTDYTKDSNVVVTDGHSKWIEDSIFTVRVQLDELNREIITECEFAYYEPAADVDNVFTYDEESDDTIFTDLAGYEYLDLRLSEDRTTAIVTYLDKNAEKEWQVELTQYMKNK